MREIFVSILPEFPKNFRRLPYIAKGVPTTSEDVPMISKGCRVRRSKYRRDLLACV